MQGRRWARAIGLACIAGAALAGAGAASGVEANGLGACAKAVNMVAVLPTETPAASPAPLDSAMGEGAGAGAAAADSAGPLAGGDSIAAAATAERPGMPDDARAAIPASVSARRQQGFGSYSPGAALGVGFAATVAPALFSVAANPIGGNSEFAWEASLALAATAGVFAGPAIGLASGGRGDLAGRGLLVRGLGLGVATAGLFGIGTMMANEESDPVSLALFFTGCAGALVTGVSAIHDLAITPSAVGARQPRAALGVRPDGMVAVSVRF